jgi:hypothetical protein
MRYSACAFHTEVMREGVKKCKKAAFQPPWDNQNRVFALLLFVGLLQHCHFVNVKRAIIKLAGNAYVMAFMPF